MRLLALLLLLCGCAQIPKGPQPQLLHRGHGHAVTVVASWKTREDIDSLCGVYRVACARTWDQDGDQYCVIYAEEPRDFNDTYRLETLGHEAWHCLGATHE